MTAEDICQVFAKLCAERPELVPHWCQFQATLTGDAEMWGGTGQQPLTEAERQATASAAQNYCDRMATMLFSLARIAGWDFPELEDRFQKIAETAAGALEDYKAQLTIRSNSLPLEVLLPLRGLNVCKEDDTVKVAVDVCESRVRFRRHTVARLVEQERNATLLAVETQMGNE